MRSTPAAYAPWLHSVNRSGSATSTPKNTSLSVSDPIFRVILIGWALISTSQQTSSLDVIKNDMSTPMVNNGHRRPIRQSPPIDMIPIEIAEKQLYIILIVTSSKYMMLPHIVGGRAVQSVVFLPPLSSISCKSLMKICRGRPLASF